MSHDTTAAQEAYLKARALGQQFAALNLARLELGTVWVTDLFQEASLAWLRTIKRYADEGDSLAMLSLTEGLAGLQAAKAEGNAEADTLLSLWEAELDQAGRTEAVEV